MVAAVIGLASTGTAAAQGFRGPIIQASNTKVD